MKISDTKMTTIVRSFLAMPGQTFAVWGADRCVTLGCPWRLLRDYVADPGCVRWGAPIILVADRDGWRDGVRVVS